MPRVVLETRQLASKSHRLSRFFVPPIGILSVRSLSPDAGVLEAPCSSPQQSRNGSSSSQSIWLSGTIHGSHQLLAAKGLQYMGRPLLCMTLRACCTTATTTVVESPTEVVQKMYDKMVDGVNSQAGPQKSSLHTLLKNCANHKDIELLFDILEKLRIFRMSNLHINANYNQTFCGEVAKQCASVGAIDFGWNALKKFNVYGLTPTIESAHYLLRYAERENDFKLAEEIIKVIRKNCIPLQVDTADIVFSICYNTENWKAFRKYQKKFSKAGVCPSLHAFEKWMDLTVKRGDIKLLWKIDKLRTKKLGKHSLGSVIACAKGFLLEHKPADAAATINALVKSSPKQRRHELMEKLKRVVSEWARVFVMSQKEDDDKKAWAAAFKADIPVMISGVSGKEVPVELMNVDHLSKVEDLPNETPIN